MLEVYTLKKSCAEPPNGTPKLTPCLKAPLVKDVDDDPCSELFACAGIVDMLLYLSGHYCPDISYIMQIELIS